MVATRSRSAVVIDDEEGARFDLMALLEREPGIEVVGEAADIERAVEIVRRERPDIVFLDIRLGHRSGFELLDRVDQTFDVIFVTAHEEHAIRAFEVDAIDYLLKPVEPERLLATLERLDAPAETRPVQPLDADDWLFLPIEGGRVFLQVASITHVEAARDYTTVHTIDGERLKVLKPLKEWEARLPHSHFLRIHRGTIVNLKRIERVEPWSNYTYRVFLKGIELPVIMSRHYAKRAERILG